MPQLKQQNYYGGDVMKRIIGKNLKLLRNANGFKLKDMANYLGIEQSTYSNYEAGLREIPLDLLEKAAMVLGCEMALLLEEDETAVKNMLVCAFRINDIDAEDMNVIAQFKEMVLNYQKMDKIANAHG